MQYLQMTLGGNTVPAWGAAVAIALGVYFLLLLFKKVLVRYFCRREEEEFDVYTLTATLADRIKKPFILIFALYAGLQALALPEQLAPWLFSIAMAALIVQIDLWGTSVVDHYLKRSAKRYDGSEKNADRMTTLRAAGFVAKLALGAIAAILILDNIPGVEITALVASLGITGIAVALAVQNILSDIFASLSIVLDKPFVLGDFIIVDNYMGTVENIGLKTTRLRSLSGEQLVFANNDLLKNRIRNYRRMAERRVVFSFGVTYQTPHEKLKDITATVREIIESIQKARFDRAHFQGYGDFALNFEVVYYVLEPDYNLYMDIQQAINLAIFSAFEEKRIDFAYPTQTIFIKENGGKQNGGGDGR